MGWVTSSVRMLIGLLTNGFLLILIVAFMIAEVYSFPRKIQYRLQLGPTLSVAFENFAGVTRTFLFTLTWLNALTAIFAVIRLGTFSQAGAPGPMGIPSRYQTTKKIIHTSVMMRKYGNIRAITVPIPDRRS